MMKGGPEASTGASELRAMTSVAVEKLYETEFKDTSLDSHIGKPVILFVCDAKAEADMVEVMATRLFKEGYTLQRYLCQDEACQKRLYGFEKLLDKK